MTTASRKRLKRNVRGSIILPSGEVITKSEQNALRSAVVSANRKAKRIIARRPKDLVKTKYAMFGSETDWLLKHKAVSFNRFKNKEEFKQYLKSVQRVASGEFERSRNKVYFENYKTALKNTFGATLGRKLIIKINKIGEKKLVDAIVSGALEADIGYIYDPTKFSEKYEKIDSFLDTLL